MRERTDKDCRREQRLNTQTHQRGGSGTGEVSEEGKRTGEVMKGENPEREKLTGDTEKEVTHEGIISK